MIDNDLVSLIKKLIDPEAKQVDYGSIEYAFFRILYEAAEANKRFTNMNGLVGVLATTQAEFIDKVLKPYENSKLLSEWAGKRLLDTISVSKKKRKSKKKQPKKRSNDTE